MMLPTHALTGVFISTLFIPIYPESAIPLILIGLIGGILPDADVLIGDHRKTLHYPVYSWVAVVPVSILYLLAPSTVTAFIVIGLSAFAAHCTMDIIGGGLSKHPWNESNPQTVYNHYKKSWIREHDSVISFKYDGSVYDTTILVLLALYIYQYVTTVPELLYIIALALGIGLPYALIRKQLPKLEDFLYEYAPWVKPFLNSLHGDE